MSRSGVNISGLGSDGLRRPLDMESLGDEASEYSWGTGLVPTVFEDASPSEGGMYRGLTPGRHSASDPRPEDDGRPYRSAALSDPAAPAP
jgi:hypothetical protein